METTRNPLYLYVPHCFPSHLLCEMSPFTTFLHIMIDYNEKKKKKTYE